MPCLIIPMSYADAYFRNPLVRQGKNDVDGCIDLDRLVIEHSWPVAPKANGLQRRRDKLRRTANSIQLAHAPVLSNDCVYLNRARNTQMARFLWIVGRDPTD